MKLFYKILVIAVVFTFSSCVMTDLDLLDNPNAVAPTNASADDLYQKVQLSFEDFYSSMWFNTAGMARMIAHTGAFDYQSATNPTNFNFLWRMAYSDMFPDMDALDALAVERGLPIHSASAKILRAYTLMCLVDLFGDVPLSQATQGTEVVSPTSDPGSDVYAKALSLLDEAIADLTAAIDGGAAPTPANDLFYNGDAAKWRTAAKSLKLRAAVTTRLVSDPTGTINALVSEGDIIDESGEDFQFNYGTSREAPNSRHPQYNNMYEANDGNYMSNYYMYLLRADKKDADGEAIEDPRLRYYFYRKSRTSDDLDINVYACHFSNFPDQSFQPAHYAAIDPDLPYCIASPDGYFGRDHLNNQSIPPDGPVRTAYGVYPMGGQFDDNSYDETQQLGTSGGLGQGIQPILLSSFMDFLRAEAALINSTNDDPRALLESGIRKSIAKVMAASSPFIDVNQQIGEDPTTTPPTPILLQALIPTDEDIDAYVAYVLDKYDNGDKDKQLDVIMKEYHIALWGNGLDAYNNYRRTGKPDNMAPALESTPGAFIRSFFYPADHVNFNQNASQKELTKQVFWDTNPADFLY